MPFVITYVGNYTTNYTIFASDGLPIFPSVTFPECTINPGPMNLPSSINIGCNLYDSKSNLL